jgi:hypothetical protein
MTRFAIREDGNEVDWTEHVTDKQSYWYRQSVEVLFHRFAVAEN